jgi:uncharacterized protein (TIGR02145 family)
MKKESGSRNAILIIILIWEITFFSGCKEDPVMPVLSTTAVSEISVGTAITGGSITADGGAEVTARGVCWGTARQPDVSGQHTSDSKGAGDFESNLTGLTPNTMYYVRAYATNKAGTAYGNEVSFTTLPLVAPVITTVGVTGIGSSSAISGGNISSDGGAEVTARGVCWATAANPTTSDNKTTNGTGTGSFTSNITGLLPGTAYHVRAYATNNIGTSYGNDLTFTASAVTPTLSTAAISGVTRTSAVSGGNISSTGGANVTARGVCWGTSSGPTVGGPHSTDGTGSGSFTSSLTGLTAGTFYHVRAYATNSAGTAYGNEQTFTTSPVQIPSVTTGSVSSVTLNSAQSGGNVTNENGATVSERGVCWNTTGNPTIANQKSSNGTGEGSFTSSLTGLSTGTTYYLRAYATNSAGTGYGTQVVFSTSVADIQGNVYRTVLIGNQLWMQSDLKTTRYNDNGNIPNVQGNTEWSAMTSPAWCWYENNPSYGNTYGILYNWYTVETGKLCPSGWHAPSDNEFITLEMYLGMTLSEANDFLWRGTDQGTRLKSTTTWYNDGPNSNSSGFTALAGGYRYGLEGTFNNLGTVSYWWCSTEHWTDTTKGAYRRLDSGQSGVHREGVRKAGGKFVRCLKNQ